MHMFKTVKDQTSGLGGVINSGSVKVIAISSGKGGVGKTNISINLAISLAREGNRVMLLDADLGLANVDVLLGLNPAYNLADVIAGERTLEEVIVNGPANVKIIPASSGVSQMANLTSIEQACLINAFSELGYMLDVLIVDTGAGISDSVINFCSASQEIVVVVCDEPASITDAYAFIKVMSQDHNIGHFQIVSNMVHMRHEGRMLFHKLSRTTDQFLDVVLTHMGSIPYDARLRTAIQQQRAVVEAFPRSPSALALKKLARQVDMWPGVGVPGGQLEFFVERLIRADISPSSLYQ